MDSSWIELDGQALLKNLKFFQQFSCVAPVIKGNAYGHGLKEIYDLLKDHVSWLCVNDLEEGELLRQWGWNGKVLILGVLSPEEYALAGALDFDVNVGQKECLEEWIKLSKKSYLHLELDTGLARQGFEPKDFFQSLLTIPKEFHIFLRGFCTHFANVEDLSDSSYAMKQMKIFFETRDQLFKLGFSDLLCHMSSSAAGLLHPQARLGMIRLGLSLYGQWPSALTRLSWSQRGGSSKDLWPVLSWKARVKNLRKIYDGDYVGYGITFRAPKTMQIGVIPVGYNEGYPRSVREGYVLCRGKRCPILGRICMNMMMIDFTDLENMTLGETVTLLGKDQEEEITSEALAQKCGTINYELLTRLSSKLPRKVRSIF